jgi:ABC-type Fe3+-hydroxamate transport system, periplasmic component
MLGLQDKADAYIQFFNSTMSMISSRISAIPDSQRPSVYFEGAGEYYTYGGAGYGSGIPGMIRDGGGIDLYPEISSYYFQVDPETVAQRNPDFIFKGQSGGYFLTNDTAFKTVHDEVASRPELANTNAVKNGHVYIMSFDIAGGARKMFGPMYIAKILYPDTFADFDPNAVLKEYLQTYMGRTWQGVYLYSGI